MRRWFIFSPSIGSVQDFVSADTEDAALEEAFDRDRRRFPAMICGDEVAVEAEEPSPLLPCRSTRELAALLGFEHPEDGEAWEDADPRWAKTAVYAAVLGGRLIHCAWKQGAGFVDTYL